MRTAVTFLLFAYPYYLVMLAQKKSNQPAHYMIVGQENASSKKGDCGATFTPMSKCLFYCLGYHPFKL